MIPEKGEHLPCFRNGEFSLNIITALILCYKTTFLPQTLFQIDSDSISESISLNKPTDVTIMARFPADKMPHNLTITPSCGRCNLVNKAECTIDILDERNAALRQRTTYEKFRKSEFNNSQKNWVELKWTNTRFEGNVTGNYYFSLFKSFKCS